MPAYQAPVVSFRVNAYKQFGVKEEDALSPTLLYN